MVLFVFFIPFLGGLFMVLVLIRVIEFILISVMPSVIGTAVLNTVSKTLFNEVISLLVFFISVIGNTYLGYRFMAITGNRKKYLIITGVSYAVFLLFCIAIYSAGSMIYNVFLCGFRIFEPIELGKAQSMVISYLILVVCSGAASLFKKKHKVNYSFGEERYNKYIVAEQNNEILNKEPDKNLLEKKRLEMEELRREYESRYTNIRPSKAETHIHDKGKKIHTSNGKNRVQEYCAQKIGERHHEPVDRETEIKKARDLQKTLEAQHWGYMDEMFSRKHNKEVDREAEIRKAQALQQQLEDEEEEKYRRIMSGKK